MEKLIKVGNQICYVQTLREWLNGRITQLRQANHMPHNYDQALNLQGRLAELMIIRQKLNDGRIQGIE